MAARRTEAPVGFNMSWTFVDGIDPDTLFAALDLAPLGETVESEDLGTGRAPLTGGTFGSEWSVVFMHYALVMDATLGTDPPRLTRLPGSSRVITCVVLEHANVSYASLWHGGRHIWQMWHQPTRANPVHLEVSGELPADFPRIRDIAVGKRRAAEEAIRKEARNPSEWTANSPFDLPADYVFDVPLDVASNITGFSHCRARDYESFAQLQYLVPITGNDLKKLSDPLRWWQTLDSIEYE